MTQTRIEIEEAFFSGHEKTLVVQGELSASLFKYKTGVEAVGLKNSLGEIVSLPYQGQQIWSAVMNGRSLGMTSMFSEPRPTKVFLETFGGFFVHCGLTAMGGPSAQDTHPLHGELPNARFERAWIELGEDQKGEFIGISGRYHFTVGFGANYVFEPTVKLHKGSSLLDVSVHVTNMKHTPFELMYLAHINYKPVDGGRLVYSAVPDPKHVRVRTSIPSHIKPAPGYVEYLEVLKTHPEQHHQFLPGQVFDPEIVFFIDYLSDESGLAHTMQIHPDGSADYVAHSTRELDHSTRWIVRTEDQQACAIVEPGTAEPEGYLAEKAKGNLKLVPPLGTWQTSFTIGMLNPSETAVMERKIKQMIDRA